MSQQRANIFVTRSTLLRRIEHTRSCCGGLTRVGRSRLSAEDIRSTISSVIALLREKEVIDQETKEEIIEALENAMGQVDHYRVVSWMRRR
jgi:hypothetical protein